MEKTIKCPYCGEEIMADAKKCRHCGEWTNDEAEPKQEPVQETALKESENQLKNEVLVTTSHEEGSLIDSVPNKPNESLFKSCFWEQITKHYCDFKGNVDRKTFWVCYLYYSLIMLVIAGVSAVAPLFGTILMTLVTLGLLLPYLGLMVRRLHDIGKKGVWILIVLIPIVGAIWLLVLLAKKGLTQNPNKWNLKDTIITIAMVVLGCGLFFVPTSSFNSEDDSEYETDSELSLLDETDIKYEISQIQFGLNANQKSLSSFMDIELKSIYESVVEKEQEYGVECECLDLVRQMENGHVKIEPVEITGVYEGLAGALVNLVFSNAPNCEALLGLAYERESSFFSKHGINKLTINSVYYDDGQSLEQCMNDWLESQSLLRSNGRREGQIEFIDINGVSHSFVEGDYAGYREDGIGYYEDSDNNMYWINADGVKYIHPYETESDYTTYSDFDYLMKKDASSYLFTKSDLSSLSPKELSYLRNQIYARHGYVFKSKELNDYFNQFSWYHPNPSVTGQELNSTEKANAEFIKRYQDENGKKYQWDERNDTYSSTRYVVIDGTELRLRLGPSTSSETLKWGDGSNRHPEVGEVFRLLDESGDFYKIDYKGNEVWVSKQFSHIEMK